MRRSLAIIAVSVAATVTMVPFGQQCIHRDRDVRPLQQAGDDHRPVTRRVPGPWGNDMITSHSGMP
jgi:hypothetical protein